MSSGHFHLRPKNEDFCKRTLAKAMGSQKVRDRLTNSKFRVDRTFDIPYLAGYSRSGDVIYVDRHLPIVIKLGGVQVAILPYLITHERTEKALLDFMGLDYDEAHQIATYAEHKELKRKGISPSAYENALDPYIKADAHEKIRRVPLNLDLKPYKDSKDERLISRMKAQME